MNRVFVDVQASRIEYRRVIEVSCETSLKKILVILL
jgi:hypothetical protein